jgi:hypothetical protein
MTGSYSVQSDPDTVLGYGLALESKAIAFSEALKFNQ